MHGQAEALHVVVEVLDDFSQRHKAIRISAFVFGARHSHLEVRRDQGERIPALISPCVSHCGRSLQHDVFMPFLAQIVTDRESSLTTTHDDSINFMRQHSYLLKRKAN